MGEGPSRTLSRVTEGVKLASQKLRWFLSSVAEPHVVVVTVFFLLGLLLPLSLFLLFFLDVPSANLLFLCISHFEHS